jgi:hypothetical protein
MVEQHFTFFDMAYLVCTRLSCSLGRACSNTPCYMQSGYPGKDVEVQLHLEKMGINNKQG